MCGQGRRRLNARLTREEVELQNQVHPGGAFDIKRKDRSLVYGRYGVAEQPDTSRARTSTTAVQAVQNCTLFKSFSHPPVLRG